jgi:hypothetical protein
MGTADIVPPGAYLAPGIAGFGAVTLAAGMIWQLSGARLRQSKQVPAHFL